MRRRLAALVAVASLLAGACSPATRVPSTDASPQPSAGASLGPAGSALGAWLRSATDVDAIMRDLGTLEAVTMAAGGSRPAGSDGEAAAVDFVVGELQAAGLDVNRETVDVPLFRQLGPGAIEIEAPDAPRFEGSVDFKPLLLSPPGDVTAHVVALGFDPGATAGSTAGRGCDAADWAGFAAGSIALVQPGPCRARIVIDHAQAAGAAAVVRSYPEWTAGRVLRPTLIDPAGLRIPVIGTTHAVGVALDDAARRGLSVRVAAATETTMRSATNVVAETRWGDATRVVMLGAHLDSVVDGPGLNDDGSGAMTVLEIARRLAGARTAEVANAARVRVVLWTGEELGLWGSFGWFRSLTPAGRGSIAAYLNLDMLGSPNGVRQVYQWSAEGIAGAAPLERLFERAFELDGLTSEPAEAGSSDDLPFAQAGIATSGVFGGHNVPKSSAQAERFGGVAGQLMDPCYHLACDTLANIDRELLGQMARASAWVTGALASSESAAR